MNENTELKLGGTFKYDQVRNGVIIDTWYEDNLVVDEGLSYILGTAFDGTTAQLPSWFLGLYSGNYTPIASDTAANIVANSTEITADYSEVARPAWVEAGVASLKIGNEASTAVFTFTSASTVVYGAFLVSTSVKGGVTGTLAAASKFATARTLLVSDVLNVSYSITAAAA